MDKQTPKHQTGTLTICEILAKGIARYLIKQRPAENTLREKDNWTNSDIRACMSHTVQQEESDNAS